MLIPLGNFWWLWLSVNKFNSHRDELVHSCPSSTLCWKKNPKKHCSPFQSSCALHGASIFHFRNEWSSSVLLCAAPAQWSGGNRREIDFFNEFVKNASELKKLNKYSKWCNDQKHIVMISLIRVCAGRALLKNRSAGSKSVAFWSIEWNIGRDIVIHLFPIDLHLHAVETLLQNTMPDTTNWRKSSILDKKRHTLLITVAASNHFHTFLCPPYWQRIQIYVTRNWIWLIYVWIAQLK